MTDDREKKTAIRGNFVPNNYLGTVLVEVRGKLNLNLDHFHLFQLSVTRL